MKYKHTVLQTPASPLKFRMVDRMGWRSPNKLSVLNMLEFWTYHLIGEIRL